MSAPGLKKALNQRQLRMIAIGGVIGAGLFVGSGVVIGDTGDGELRLKMWLFPVLSILTALAMLAILVQMFLDDELRWQLVLSLLSWAVVLGLFFLNKRFNTSHRIDADAAEAKARALR